MATLDDLRARMHDINRRQALLANDVDRLAVDLQNYQPDPPAPPPPPQPTRPVAQYGRFLHEVDKTYSIPVQEARYGLQVIQGDEWHMDQLRALQPGPTLTLRYATPVARRVGNPGEQGDPKGDSTCLPPGQIPDAWMLRDTAGNIIRRDRDGDEFVDVGNTQYQQAAAKYLAERCKREGWDGIWLDEINADPRWSFPGNLPVKRDENGTNLYGTVYRYQVAIRSFVNAIVPVLRAAGLQVWINLAGDYDSAWANGLARESDGHTIEFFVARGSHETANLLNGYWGEALDWVTRREAEKTKGFYNAQTTDLNLARYALATYLLATDGSGYFGAAVDGYPVSGTVWTSDMDNARKLGQPLGAFRINTAGLRVRDFEHGTVTVNPSTKPINTLPAMSGQIELR